MNATLVGKHLSMMGGGSMIYDSVLTDSAYRPRLSGDFLELSSVYPCCITILKNVSRSLGSWWVAVLKIASQPWRENSGNSLGWPFVDSLDSYIIVVISTPHLLFNESPRISR